MSGSTLASSGKARARPYCKSEFGATSLTAEPTLEDLDADPYEVFDRLRPAGGIHWVQPLQLWYVIDHRLVRDILQNSTDFVTGTNESLIFDTFGENMLTVEGPEQLRYRSAFRHAFSPQSVRERMSSLVLQHVDNLIDGFETSGHVELRNAFASRLPILSILSVFGLALELERRFRRWYDDFEAALSNFEWKQDIRNRAAGSVAEFHKLLQQQIETLRDKEADGLLSQVVNAPPGERLTDEEIRRNALIILFGGISTVEALILNSTVAILSRPEWLEQIRHDRNKVAVAIEEAVRWQSPVQSATRHVVRDVVVGGKLIAAGSTVNCMLGGANRDPGVFEDPERLDWGRNNLRRHVSFATGPHTCLGNHLARLEGRLALMQLVNRLPNLRVDGRVEFRGYEFRQPRRLDLVWDPAV